MKTEDRREAERKNSGKTNSENAQHNLDRTATIFSLKTPNTLHFDG